MIGQFIGGLIAIIVAAVMVLGTIFGMSLVFSIPIWLLWTWIVVGVLHIFPVPLTWIQALGLNLLASCLFKSHSTEKKIVAAE